MTTSVFFLERFWHLLVAIITIPVGLDAVFKEIVRQVLVPLATETTLAEHVFTDVKRQEVFFRGRCLFYEEFFNHFDIINWNLAVHGEARESVEIDLSIQHWSQSRHHNFKDGVVV